MELVLHKNVLNVFVRWVVAIVYHVFWGDNPSRKL